MKSLYLATAGGGAFFEKVGSFEGGFELDAVVLDDSVLPCVQPLSVRERIERAAYLSADLTALCEKYVRGRKVYERVCESSESRRRYKIHTDVPQRSRDEYGQNRCGGTISPQGSPIARNRADGRLYGGFRQVGDDAEETFFSCELCSQQTHRRTAAERKSRAGRIMAAAAGPRAQRITDICGAYYKTKRGLRRRSTVFRIFGETV